MADIPEKEHEYENEQLESPTAGNTERKFNPLPGTKPLPPLDKYLPRRFSIRKPYKDNDGDYSSAFVRPPRFIRDPLDDRKYLWDRKELNELFKHNQPVPRPRNQREDSSYPTTPGKVQRLATRIARFKPYYDAGLITTVDSRLEAVSSAPRDVLEPLRRVNATLDRLDRSYARQIIKNAIQ